MTECEAIPSLSIRVAEVVVDVHDVGDLYTWSETGILEHVVKGDVLVRNVTPEVVRVSPHSVRAADITLANCKVYITRLETFSYRRHTLVLGDKPTETLPAVPLVVNLGVMQEEQWITR